MIFESFHSQSAANDVLYTAGIKKIGKPIKIDGILDDEGWQNITLLSPFKEQFPFDSSLAIGKTEVRLNSNFQSESFNRVAGMDFNYASSSTRWQGKFFYHQGFTPEKKIVQNAMGANVEYNTTKWNFEGQITNVGANYDPQVGFAPRTDYIRHSVQFNKVHFPFGNVSPVINNFYQ